MALYSLPLLYRSLLYWIAGYTGSLRDGWFSGYTGPDRGLPQLRDCNTPAPIQMINTSSTQSRCFLFSFLSSCCQLLSVVARLESFCCG